MTAHTNGFSETYLHLRNMAFQLVSDRLGSKSRSERATLAAIMEFVRPKAVVTLLAVADGTASLYFSSGGGVIGAGESESVQVATLDFIAAADRTGEEWKQASDHPLPRDGFVTFHVIASGIMRSIEVSEDDLKLNDSRMSALFHKGHNLISIIRQHEDKRTT
jgi:hypothetical protein